MFKLTKEHEGGKFWCVPTQNNVSRYGDRDPLSQAKLKEVSNVKRIYLELDGTKYRLASYDQDLTRAQYNSSNNAGWSVFESEVDFLKYKVS